MTKDRSPSSAPQACLDRAYASSQKGGTLIAEDVLDLETHERRLEDPGGYRPEGCRRCRSRVHVHDLRPRQCIRSGNPGGQTGKIWVAGLSGEVRKWAEVLW
jgi:hypothetical protein